MKISCTYVCENSGGSTSTLGIQIHEDSNFIWQPKSSSASVIVIPDGDEKIPFEGFINFS